MHTKTNSTPWLWALALILGTSLSINADAKGKTKKGQTAQTPSGKLDISDLEQKYWAPKDTDFSVVQNRTYTKAKRFSANFLTGPILNDTYSSGFNYSFSGSYYFSERHGVEASIIRSDLGNSEATDEFIGSLSGGGVAPDFGRVRQHIGVAYTFVPFYAKMSLMGKKIIYFDMSISPGFGITKYESAADGSKGIKSKENSVFAYSLDISQYFFLSRHIAIRADLRNRWYREKVYKYTTGEKLRTKNTNTTLFLMGVTYFF
jgi:outer membrane beta-barrel protein